MRPPSDDYESALVYTVIAETDGSTVTSIHDLTGRWQLALSVDSESREAEAVEPPRAVARYRR